MVAETFSPSRAEIGEAGFMRNDVPVPPSSASSLSGGKGNTSRQQGQQGCGCQGNPNFSQWVPGCGAQGTQGGAHGVMTGCAGYPGGVGSNLFSMNVGNLAGAPSLAGNSPDLANGSGPQNGNGPSAGNLDGGNTFDPWSAWFGTSGNAPSGCGQYQNSGNSLNACGGMTRQVAAYQQILSLLPSTGGPQMLALRQVLHDARTSREFRW